MNPRHKRRARQHPSRRGKEAPVEHVGVGRGPNHGDQKRALAERDQPVDGTAPKQVRSKGLGANMKRGTTLGASPGEWDDPQA